MERRGGEPQTSIEQVEFDPCLITHAFFRIERGAAEVRAIVRLERLRGVGEQPDLRYQLIEHTDTRRDLFMSLLGAPASNLIVQTLFVVVIAGADDPEELVGKANLVLQVQRPAMHQLIAVNRTRRVERRTRCTVDRVVEIDGAQVVGAQHEFAQGVTLVIGADQKLMLDRTGIEAPTQLQLGDRVLPVVVAITQVAGQRAVVCCDLCRFGGVAIHPALLVVAGQAQRPDFVEVVFEFGLQRFVVVADRPIRGFAIER